MRKDKNKTSQPADAIMFMLKIPRNHKPQANKQGLSKIEGRESIVQNSIMFLKLAVNNQNKSKETVPFRNNIKKTHTHKNELSLCTENYKA